MKKVIRKYAGTAVAAIAVGSAGAAITVAAPVAAQSAETGELNVLSIGRGKQVNLSSSITDVFVADPEVADVDVKSPRQLYIFGRGQGETTIYATDASGRTVYSSTVRVGGNIDSIDQMLGLAMPGADIRSATMNGIVLLTGTVRNPEDAAEAEELVQAFVGEETRVVSRLKLATPLQVNLRVRFAEVDRSLAKEISSNIATRDQTGGFQFGLFRGRTGAVGIDNFDVSNLPVIDASASLGLPAGTISLPYDPVTGQFVSPNGGTQFDFTGVDNSNTLALAGKLFGLDIGTAFDLTARMGLTAMLAEPNLTVSSGTTGEFLAGGEIPIPVAQGLGDVSVEYKSYGVSLSYTPTVLSNGRISLRLRPEVSEIDNSVAVPVGNSVVPGLRSRRVETTVELGSGQSFMIAGLLSNSSTGVVDKLPGVGDVPILGNLFKSDQWRRNETELVVIVTPYLVEPVNEDQIKLPTDGYRAATDWQRLLLNKQSDGKSGSARPMAEARENQSYTPPGAPPVAPVPARRADDAKSGSDGNGPGFSFE